MRARRAALVASDTSQPGSVVDAFIRRAALVEARRGLMVDDGERR